MSVELVSVFAGAAIKPLVSVAVSLVHSSLSRRASLSTWNAVQEALDLETFSAGVRPGLQEIVPSEVSHLADQQVQAYLGSREFAAVVHQTLLARLAQTSAYALDPIRDEHRRLFRLYASGLPDHDR